MQSRHALAVFSWDYVCERQFDFDFIWDNISYLFNKNFYQELKSVEALIYGSHWQILGSFLENDYCGPGTLLVHPFLDMKSEIKERGLPGAPQAARAAIAWAEKNIDKDWKAWTGEY